MKAPESLETLIEYGVIQDVLRPLMSGKEAQVFVVLAAGEECVAKVYKEATQRTFKHRAVYTEGRRTRNSRDQRAMSKRSQHGRKKDEEAWRSTEVDMIYRLRDAGVRVPEPINFVEGVLVMELVKGADGLPAPRLGDLTFSPEEARNIYHALVREVVRMLCGGVIHGDLSEFNVLMTDTGPVVIDFPQAVDPTSNPNSKKLLLRDVANLDRFLARFAPDEPAASYGEEIWSLFETNRLRPDTKLSGRFDKPKGKVDTAEVMALIEDADRENRMRRRDRDDLDDELAETTETAPSATAVAHRRVVDFSAERAQPSGAGRTPASNRGAKKRRARAVGSKAGGSSASDGASAKRRRVPPAGPAADSDGKAKQEAAPAKGRRRRPRNASSKRASDGDSNTRREADEAPGRSRRSRASRRAEEGPKPPAGPRAAQTAGESKTSEKPRRARSSRSRSASRPNGDSTDKPAPAKRRGESRSKSTGARPAGERPTRRRRRGSPNERTTR